MKNVSLIILLVTILSSCQKQVKEVILLPEITTSGNNMMGFLYNNSLWQSIKITPGYILTALKVDTLISGRHVITVSPNSNSFSIWGGMYVKENNQNITANSQIYIYLINFSQGSGSLNFDTTRNGNKVFFKDDLTNKRYSNFTNSFQLVLTKFDTTNKIASGQFSGTLYASRPNPINLNQQIFTMTDSMTIKQGRFDIKYEKIQ
jgi:hypothetical protein